MTKSFSVIFRVLALTLALLAPWLVSAQDTLVPKWTAGSWPATTSGYYEGPKFSKDGSKVLLQLQGGFAVYNYSTGKMLCHLSSFYLTSACLSADGNSVYYGTGATPGFGLYEYNLASGSVNLLPGVSEHHDMHNLRASADGNTLLLCYDYAGGKDVVIVYSLATHTLTSRILTTIQNSHAEFVDGDTRVLTNGPTVYRFDGTIDRAVASPLPGAFSVSQDRSKFLYLASDGSFRAYSTASLGVLWSAASVPSDEFEISRDNGAALFMASTASIASTGQWVVSSLSMATGAPLSSQVTSQHLNVSANVPRIAISPVSDEIILGPNSEPNIETWNYNSSTGAGTFGRPFAVGLFDDSLLTPHVVTTGGVSTTGFSVSGRTNLSAIPVSSRIVDVINGSVLASTAAKNSRPVFSPDGTYYAITYQKGVEFYRTSTNALIRSYNMGGSNLKPIHEVGWANSSLLWVNWKPTSYVTTLLRFNGGSSVSQVATLPGDVGVLHTLVTSDEQYLVVGASDTGTSVVRVYSIPSGNLLSTINQSASGNRNFWSMGLLSGNRLWASDSSTTDNTVRIFSLSGTSVTLLKSFTADNLTTSSSGTKVTVSPNGTYYAFYDEKWAGTDSHATGSVRIFRAADGSLIRRWDDQLIGAFPRALAFSADEFVLAWTVSGVIVVTVVPASLTSISMTPASVVAGSSATATVTLNRVANQDTVVHPNSSSSLVDVPSSVTIPAGSSNATFTVTSHGVNAVTTVPINCTYSGGSVSADLTITPASALSVSLDRADIEGIGTCAGTVTLNAPAGPGGLSVTVTSSKTSSAVVSPATVIIPEGSTTGTFTVTTKSGTGDFLVTFTASAGSLNSTVNLMVARLSPVTLTLDKTTMTGGGTATLTIKRSAAAPTGGLNYQLSSNNASIIVSGQIFLPAGETTLTVTVNTLVVTTNATGTISLTRGSQVKTIDLTITAVVVTSLSCSPTDVTGNGSVDVTINFSGPVPSGYSVVASSSAAAITVPSSISIPVGQTTFVVTLPVKKVTADKVVTITIGGKTVNVTLHKP